VLNLKAKASEMVALEVNKCGGLSQLPVAGSKALRVATSGEPDPKRNALRTCGNREALEAPVRERRHLCPDHIEVFVHFQP